MIISLVVWGNVSDNAFRSVSMVHLLQRLTIFAVNTGIWTATFAVLCLIMVRSSPLLCDVS